MRDLNSLPQLVLKSHCRIEPISLDEVVILSERGDRHIFKGMAFVRVLPMLVKGSSADALIDAVQGEISEAEVFYVISALQQRGLLDQENPRFPESLKGYCHHLGVSFEEAAPRIETTLFEVISLRTAKGDFLKEILGQLSLCLSDRGNFQVVLADSYRAPELKAIHQRSLETGCPWLLAKPEGAEIWIGPLFQPKQPGCYACLLERFEQNQIEERFVEKKQGSSTPIAVSSAMLPTFPILASHLIANELVKWVLCGANRNLDRQVMCFDAGASTLTVHPFSPRPFCRCAPKRSEKPFVLESQKKGPFRDGGYRSVHPEETLRRFSHLLSPITGLISSLRASLHNQSAGMALFAGGSHYCGLDVEKGIQDQRFPSVGKGKSETQAKVRCLAEALERWSGFFHEGVVRKKGTYGEFGGEAIPPNEITLFSAMQYQKRISWNQKYGQNPFLIPAPFCEETPLDWTPVWSLTNHRSKWVPTALCYTGYPLEESERLGRADSSGCAAGNTKEEALLQGLFELIERDHLAIWWYNRLSRPGIDLHSFEDPSIGQMVDYYTSLGREVWGLDLTLDLAVPTFGIFSRNARSKGEEIAMGFAAHFDPEIALCRAFSEMHQMHDYLDVKKTREAFKPHDLKDRMIWDWLAHGTLDAHPFLCPQLPRKSKHDYRCIDNSDLREDLLLCQKILEGKGMEILVLDQTRADLGFPVIRVIVPGLRSKRNRFAPGRLYDVPFEMGLIPQKRAEEDFNPLPLFV